MICYDPIRSVKDERINITPRFNPHLLAGQIRGLETAVE